MENKPVSKNIWGPHLWKTIHYLTLGYPEKPSEKQKQKYKEFFILFKDVLPCSACAQHYSENYEKNPLTDEILDDREKVIKWGIDLHNTVNKMKDKEVIPYEKAREMLGLYESCNHLAKSIDKSTTIMSLSLLLLGLITIGIIYKRK